MKAATYREADSLVMPALKKWRRKSQPYEQDEMVDCPACGGKIRFQQFIFDMKEARTKVHATCQTAFCVNYKE